MTDITIQAKEGGSFGAYLALPAALPAPGLLVIQEIFGVNAVMRGICDDFARQGFVALCPDIFWRQEPGIQLTDRTEDEWKRAFALYQGFNVDMGIKDLDAALQALRQRPECTGKAGAMGFCLGGKLAYLMATRTDADCAVSYYGVGIEDLLDEAAQIQQPLMMHIAGRDKFVPAEAQQKIQSVLSRNSSVTLYLYQEMEHAFARKGGEHYDEDAAQLAHARTAGFLKQYLAD